MSKWLFLGFIAGALSSALLFKVVEGRRTAAAEEAAKAVAAAKAEADGRAAEAAAGALAKAEEKFERAVAEGARTYKENLELKKQLAASGRPPGPGGPVAVGSAAPKKRTFRQLAADLAGLRDKLKGKKWDAWPPEAKELQDELLARMNELAKSMGLSLEEAMRSPEALGLLVDLLAQSVPPLDAAQEAKLRELLAAESDDWKAFMSSRDQMTALEARRKLLDLVGASRESFFSALTPEQREMLGSYGIFDSQIQGSQTWFDGPRAKVTQEILAQWSSTLSLSETQSKTVAPIVDEYINKSRDLNESIWTRRKNGEELSREKDYAMRVDLMIETQKKISDTLSLTPDQQKAMKGWGFTYGANVTDEMDK
ncbi:MAG: hypothetical protein K8T20_08075 [Planctomycetes bacterium]|nr:hypothetical protein [Planctomycetota bacterium]